MFEKRLTLLIIPEEGEKTHEFKVPRIVFWAVGLCLLCGIGLIAVGMHSFAQSRDLEKVVVHLQREKTLLKAEVEQIGQLSSEKKRCLKLKWNKSVSLSKCCCVCSAVTNNYALFWVTGMRERRKAMQPMPKNLLFRREGA